MKSRRTPAYFFRFIALCSYSVLIQSPANYIDKSYYIFSLLTHTVSLLFEKMNFSMDKMKRLCDSICLRQVSISLVFIGFRKKKQEKKLFLIKFEITEIWMEFFFVTLKIWFARRNRNTCCAFIRIYGNINDLDKNLFILLFVVLVHFSFIFFHYIFMSK